MLDSILRVTVRTWIISFIGHSMVFSTIGLVLHTLVVPFPESSVEMIVISVSFIGAVIYTAKKLEE